MGTRIGGGEPLNTRNFIRAWREHRGLSQDKLVARLEERLGTSFSKASLSRLESGKQPWTQRTLEALAWALACEPADLVMRDPNDPVWSIMDTLRKLPPNEQQRIARMIQGYAHDQARTGTEG